MDRDRIGGLGVTKVCDYIWNIGYMKPDIRHHDNIPIWDGDIYVYKTQDDLNNNNFTYRLPVQVKSHYHEYGEFPMKVSFDIEVRNLYNYQAEGGVVFFYVYVRRNEHQIYVNYLTRKRIKDILKGKESQKTISVDFTKITLDEAQFLRELNTLHLQRRYVTKSLKDFDTNKTLEIIFDKDYYGLSNASDVEIEQYLATHNVDLLLRSEDSENIFYPEEGRVSLAKRVETVGNLKFGSLSIRLPYKILNTSKGYLYIIEDGWFRILEAYDNSDLITVSISFKPSLFRETIQRIRILDSVKDGGQVDIGGKQFVSPVMNKSSDSYKNLIKIISFWRRMEMVCNCLNIYHNFDVSNLDEDDIKKFKMLYAAYVDKKEVTSSLLKDHLSLTTIGEVRILSWVKITHGNQARMFNLADQMVVAYKCDVESNQKLLATPFTALFAYKEIPSNIQLDNLAASYTEAYSQNPLLVERAILDLLNLLVHFDKTKRNELLSAAKTLSEWIKGHVNSEEVHIARINELQIKLRENKMLNDDEIYWLNERYDTTDNQLEKFSCATLLSEYHRARHSFNRLSEDEKKVVVEWPIYNLYKKLSNNNNG